MDKCPKCGSTNLDVAIITFSYGDFTQPYCKDCDWMAGDRD